MKNKSVQPLLNVRVSMDITNNDPSKNYLPLTFVSHPLVCKALPFLPSDLESTSRQIHTTVKICHKGPP